MTQPESETPKTRDLKDVVPGSDADETPAYKDDEKPRERKPETDDSAEVVDGEQLDDNIDDLGNKSGGGSLDQPT
ncbi:MAG: hypothetical protein P0Y65_17130 [Candidatus Devosia phytovorans]|uniref:Uncharacterized protein n=1 Tax=Candidatus Devosia phytovorans TaxID=3121372 RepID=A0AAJ5VTH7_9HYPH|nr:hypothetical protein [Devosia sp.]WEK03895.1 MAG: hypothetical protein P0Y65_17130 [Devosia sp.]